MNIEECFLKGLLLKTRPDQEKANKSMETAEHKLSLSKKEFNAEIYEGSIINSYASMFHSARAILFREGVKERSHYGIYIYLKEKHEEGLGNALLNEFSALRLQRHEVLYGFSEDQESITKDEAESVLSAAESFLEKAKMIASGG